MSTAQLQKAIIEKSKGLSDEALEEVLDFITFLKTKGVQSENDSINSALSNLDKSELSHVEEEFYDYKKLYPSE